MTIGIFPKYSVVKAVGYIKGKIVIYNTQTFLGNKFNYDGQDFWTCGYYVSAVRRDEKTIQEYVKKQGEHDRKLDQWNLFVCCLSVIFTAPTSNK